MPSGALDAGLVGAISTSCCGSGFHHREKLESGLAVIVFICFIRSCMLRIGLVAGCEHGAEAMRLDRRRTERSCRFQIRLQFDAMVEIEVSHAGFRWHRHLPSIDVVFVAVHDGPDRLVCERPAAGEDAVDVHRVQRFPSGLARNGATPRSIVAMRRVASPSRGVMPFQMPQMFSQLSQPTPLKKANCRSSVLLRFQRSEMLTMWRDLEPA